MIDQLASREAQCLFPVEILYDVLVQLPSRKLLSLKSVSHRFSSTISSIIRSRLLTITQDETQELVFESSCPSEYRATQRHLIEFSSFLKANLAGPGIDVAEFILPSVSPVRQRLLLDDEEEFGSFLLSVHLRGADKDYSLEESGEDNVRLSSDNSDPMNSSSSLSSRSSSFLSLPSTSLAANLARSPRSYTSFAMTSGTPPPTPPNRNRARFSFSLTLAEGLERLFRSMFESESDLQYSKGTDYQEKRLGDPPGAIMIPTAHSDKSKANFGFGNTNDVVRTKSETLSPSGSCALLTAHIECVQVESKKNRSSHPSHRQSSSHSFSAYGSTRYVPSEPRIFEFYYTHLRLDVSRIVVTVEEGMSHGCKRGDILLWMRV